MCECSCSIVFGSLEKSLDLWNQQVERGMLAVTCWACCDMLGTSYQLHPNNNPHFDATHDTSGDSAASFNCDMLRL